MIDKQDWLDDLLRDGRPVPVPDEGFAAQVMTRLPSRARVAPRWLLPVSVAIGAISAIGVLGTSDTVVTSLQLLVGEHRLSVAALLPVVLVWAGCAWALSESR
jgi:hypothetical protein